MLGDSWVEGSTGPHRLAASSSGGENPCAQRVLLTIPPYWTYRRGKRYSFRSTRSAAQPTIGCRGCGSSISGTHVITNGTDGSHGYGRRDVSTATQGSCRAPIGVHHRGIRCDAFACCLSGCRRDRGIFHERCVPSLACYPSGAECNHGRLVIANRHTLSFLGRRRNPKAAESRWRLEERLAPKQANQKVARPTRKQPLQERRLYFHILLRSFPRSAG